MKVLVVVDMQNDFIYGALDNKEAQAIVPNVVEKIKNFDGVIIATKDTHFDNYLETQEGKNLPIPHCIRETDGWKLNKDVMDAIIDSRNDYITLEKEAFGSIVLNDVYGSIVKDYDADIDEVEIVGVCTDICVISNALITKAIMPEVLVVVDASCCAGVTPESHKIALEAMKVCQIKVINE